MIPSVGEYGETHVRRAHEALHHRVPLDVVVARHAPQTDARRLALAQHLRMNHLRSAASSHTTNSRGRWCVVVVVK